jgi:fructoselysine-6-P-deglycase FrlB-like protein
MSVTSREIESQPAIWRQVLTLLDDVAATLPQPQARLALVGCGTSYYVGCAAAAVRESAGQGESDAFVASEMPLRRRYATVLAISRSGTTTEVVRALSGLPAASHSVAISATTDSPVVAAADEAIVIPFADEASIVQTRFATAVLALLRAHAGEDLTGAIADAEHGLTRSLPIDPCEYEQFVFLGAGWTVGLACEAALKFREAAGAWAESYPAMEYRHGPISVAGPATLVWILGRAERALVEDIRATGAQVLESDADPMAELVTVQRVAVELAAARGLDPDHPHHLTRSVVLR